MEKLSAPLVIPIQSIKDGSSENYEIEVSADEIGFDEYDHGFTFVDRIVGQIDLLRMNDDFQISGELTTTIELECRRCVVLFDLAISASLNTRFYKSRKYITDPFDQIYGERPFSENELDLTEDFYQAILFEIPTWAVCSESCEPPKINDQGEPKTDSPFAQLADLLQTTDVNDQQKLERKLKRK